MRYCLNGQQRLLGMLASDNPPELVPVLSFECSSVEEEADLFSIMNEQRKAVSWKRNVNAIAGLHVLYKSGGEDAVEVGLTALLTAWPDEPSATSGAMMQLMADLIAEQNGDGPADADEFAAKLAKTTPGRITRRAAEMQFELGGSKRVNVRRAAKTLGTV